MTMWYSATPIHCYSTSCYSCVATHQDTVARVSHCTDVLKQSHRNIATSSDLCACCDENIWNHKTYKNLQSTPSLHHVCTEFRSHIDRHRILLRDCFRAETHKRQNACRRKVKTHKHWKHPIRKWTQ